MIIFAEFISIFNYMLFHLVKTNQICLPVFIHMFSSVNKYDSLCRQFFFFVVERCVETAPPISALRWNLFFFEEGRMFLLLTIIFPQYLHAQKNALLFIIQI